MEGGLILVLYFGRVVLGVETCMCEVFVVRWMQTFSFLRLLSCAARVESEDVSTKRGSH